MTITEIADLVNDELDTDIRMKRRNSPACMDAKRIFAKLAYQFGFSLREIGDEIQRDHATALHHKKKGKHFLRYPDFAAKHDHIYHILIEKMKPVDQRSEETLRSELLHLSNQIILIKRELQRRFLEV